MSDRLSIKTILNNPRSSSNTTKVSGWVRSRRDSKAGISFIALSDGSCFDSLQLVVPNTLDNYDAVLQITAGFAIEAIGSLVKSEGKNQAIEMQVTALNIIGGVSNPESYPMAAKRHTMEHLREHSHLRPRTNIIGAIARVRNGIAQAIHQFLNDDGYIWVNTPILTACDCEGAGELFTVTSQDLNNLPLDDKGKVDFSKDFFGEPAYLTCSGQLNLEAYCMALSKVYCFGPTFRAENSNTTRHLAEFWMLEPELAFADLSDAIDLAERLLKAVCSTILENFSDDLAFFEKWVDKDCVNRIKGIINGSFERITYTEAISLLQQSNKSFEFPVEWGTDLQTEHERYLTEELLKKPVVVTDYPKDIKAFYMRVNDDNKTVAAMDVLLPGIGEIIGGSQREERYDHLMQRIHECDLNEEEYQWVLDLRRYGSVPHSGFGLGFERLIRYITGVNNVREITPFPRTPNNIAPSNTKARHASTSAV